MVKVEKSTNEAMEWMNNKLNLQNKQSLTMDPVVKAKEIEAKIKVMYDFKDLIVFSSQSHYYIINRREFHYCIFASGLGIGWTWILVCHVKFVTRNHSFLSCCSRS